MISSRRAIFFADFYIFTILINVSCKYTILHLYLPSQDLTPIHSFELVEAAPSTSDWRGSLRTSSRRRSPSAGSATDRRAQAQRSLMRPAGAAPPRPVRGSHHPPPGTTHPAPSATRPHLPPPSTSPQPRQKPVYPPPVSSMICGHHSPASASPLASRRWLPPLDPLHATSRGRR